MSTVEKTRKTLTRMTPPDVVRLVGRLLKAGLKKDAIAKRAGVSTETVRRIERGQIKPDERAWARLNRAASEEGVGPTRRCRCGLLTNLVRCVRCHAERYAGRLELVEETPADDPTIEFLPDEEEIAFRAQVVRAHWPPGEEERRLRCDERRVPARTPEIEYGAVAEFLPDRVLREATIAADRRPRILLTSVFFLACLLPWSRYPAGVGAIRASWVTGRKDPQRTQSGAEGDRDALERDCLIPSLSVCSVDSSLSAVSRVWRAL